MWPPTCLILHNPQLKGGRLACFRWDVQVAWELVRGRLDTMPQNNQALKVALAAAQQLPPKLQRQLAEQLIRTTRPEQSAVMVYLQRLSPRKQARLTTLMDKHNDGRLSQMERKELQRLGTEVDKVLLANSSALARALRPELFDERGKPMPYRFRQALQASGVERTTAQREHGRG